MTKKKLWKKMAAMAVLGTAFVLGGHAVAAEAAVRSARSKSKPRASTRRNLRSAAS